MRYLSLFSGIEACSAAWKPLGWECAAVAEIETFPSNVLTRHYPGVQNLGNVLNVTDAQIQALGHIDVVVGGSPCQDLSVAGKRAGLEGARSGLFHEQLRIFNAARHFCGARFLLWENVPGAFSSKQGRDFAVVVSEMAGTEFTVPAKKWQNSGAAIGPNGLVEWCVLDAQYFGLAQRRKRVFAILDTGNWADRPPILLESKSVCGDSPPSRETGQEVTGTLSARTKGGGGLGTDFDLAGGLVPALANPLTARMHKGVNTTCDEGQTMIPIIAFHPTQDPISSTDGTTHALGCGSSHGQASIAIAIQDVSGREKHQNDKGWSEDGIAYTVDAAATQGVAVSYAVPSVAPCLTSNYGKQPDNSDTNAGPMLLPVAIGAFKGGQGSAAGGIAFDERVSPTLSAADSGTNRTPALLYGMQVRKLTPIECERLQGFPDNYTQITWRGKPAERCPDGPRYKALGNSMAVPVMRWIGEKIQAASVPFVEDIL